jgi:hypothetical protein
MSSPTWIALSMAAISRTLVDGTWLKMLRDQFTMGSLKKQPLHPPARWHDVGNREGIAGTGTEQSR